MRLVIDVLDLTLIRKTENEHGTFGELHTAGDTPEFIAVTLENRWLDNAPFVSCIPAGQYVCGPTTTPKHGFGMEVRGVPGRSAILFHTGNWSHETKGCILPGTRWDDPNHPTMILESANGLKALMDRVRELPAFGLTIVDHTQHGGA